MHDNMTVVLVGPGVRMFQLLQLKHALALEIKGLRYSRGSVYAHVKRVFGFKGNKVKVLAQLEAHIAEQDKKFQVDSDEAMEQARHETSQFPRLYE